MANTVFRVEHGLDVVGSANVANTMTVSGNLVIQNVSSSSDITVNTNVKPINNNFSLGDGDQRWGLIATSINVANDATLSNTLSVVGESTFYANVVPNANNIKLGDTTKRWDLYANNANVLTVGVVSTLTTANLSVTNTATVSGTLIVNPGLANALVVTGNTTHSNVTISGNVSNFGGNSSFDAGVLFVNATDNRVGINNTTPTCSYRISSLNITTTTRNKTRTRCIHTIQTKRNV